MVERKIDLEKLWRNWLTANAIETNKDGSGYESRWLELKGISEQVTVRVRRD